MILFSILTAYFLWQTRCSHAQFIAAEAMDDDLVDELYPKTFRYLEYVIILYNIVASMMVFNLLLGIKFIIGRDSVDLVFSIFDFF